MEKIGLIIKDYKEDIEIYDETWINIHIICNKIKEILKEDYEILEMNWNNISIKYQNNNFFIDRTAFPNGSSKYLIKRTTNFKEI